ncbi:hypothetical protein HRR83_008097 [Exophiala dermatitidis]|uniref:Uncharacterized protein n=1 Tax=Exophiala dermatitidis TaxID=5970 RepID=A0AAN6IWR5_EXODE|nr:hypothetical protein HRR74_008847 [Exophiala dermatitidis]KAJ4513527.1 hypothetical protein HRR73_005685 [Exophiala dermatitidis]KAJ4535695.1 hypothetical protein HRR77_007643 [Exophiala dermatitidis]KAJ4544557.1 hypothetical protein HRR76_002612 [Exophiala dermatitidis]KAJ4561379.1 hypothetical protein HRR79_007212 [Exophiala dermatitidis]
MNECPAARSLVGAVVQIVRSHGTVISLRMYCAVGATPRVSRQRWARLIGTWWQNCQTSNPAGTEKRLVLQQYEEGACLYRNYWRSTCTLEGKLVCLCEVIESA